MHYTLFISFPQNFTLIMHKINAKDKKFDTDIAALEQERNAIKTEIDTLKTVAKDNVERTFKLFS